MGSLLDYANNRNKTKSANKGSLGYYVAKKKVGFDTFESDLASASDLVNRVYGGWHSAEDMNSSRQTVSAMRDRLTAYKDYTNDYSNGQDLTEFNTGMDKLIGAYDTALGGWDALTENYAMYSDADAYKKAADAARELKKIAESEEGKRGWEKYLSDNEAKKNTGEKKTVGQTMLQGMGDTSSDSFIGTAINNIINMKRNDTTYREPAKEWTDDERHIFGAYYLENPDKAYQYAAKLNEEKSVAAKNKQKQKISESATSGFGAGLGHTVGALLTAPTAILDYMDDLTSFAANRPITDTGVLTPFEYSQAVTGSIASKLNENYGTLNESIPIIGGKGVGDVYGLGTSVAQSALSAHALGSAGTLVSYFGQGAASGMDEALSRGATDEQAVLFGTIVGAAEGVSEHIGADRLLKVGDLSSATIKDAFKEVFKQAGAEGLEEGFSSIIGEIADALIMQDKSVFSNAVREYTEKGMSEADATKKAFVDSIERILYDSLSGAVSGGVHASPHIAQTQFENASVGKYIAKNDRMDTLSELAETEGDSYEKYISLLNSGKASNAKAGSLYRQMENAAVRDGDVVRLSELSRVFTPKTEEEVEVQKKVDSYNVGNATVDNETGSAIKLQGIRTDESGNTVLKTGAGEKTIDSVTLNRRDAEVVAIAEGMEQSQADLFVSMYSGQDTAAYKNSFDLTYAYGKNAYGVDNAIKRRGVLTEEQALKVYKLGISERTSSQQKQIDAITEKHFAEGGKMVEGKFDDTGVDYTKLNSRQKAAASFAKMFSRATGVNVVLFESKADEKGVRKAENGRYESGTNTIYMDVYAGFMESAGVVEDAMIPTLSHELTHWMKEKAPEAYAKLSDIVMDTLSQHHNVRPEVLVAAEKDNHKKRGRDVSDEYAQDELIARACEDMLSGNKTANEIIEKMDAETAKTFSEKFKEMVAKIRAWLKDLLKAYKSGSEEATILRKYDDKLAELQKAWDEAFAKAVRANQAMQNSKTEDVAASERTQNSERIEIGMSDEERYNILKNKSIELIAKTDADKMDQFEEKYAVNDVYELKEGERKKLFKKLGDEFSVFKQYENADVELSFVFSKGNMAESTNKQKGNYDLFAKMFSCFDDVVSSAVGIEVHNRNDEGYKKDPTLKGVYVLVSAFEDGSYIVPVKLEVKEFNDKNNTLYVAIALESIKKDEVVKKGNTTKGVTQFSRSSKISIPDLFRKINASDESFVKYIPKQFFDEGVQRSDRDEADHVKTVEEYFGRTYNINEAGYILTNGHLLDMSGKHEGAPGGYRTVDHRDISDALGDDYGGDDYSGAMIAFMSEGNIRIMPEGGGINVSVKPNSAQMEVLSRYVSKFRGEVTLDIDDLNGNTIASVEYPKFTHANTVLKDITDYFDKGKIPESFNVAYSYRDSEGNGLTKEQIEFFKDSKLRDENGNLKVMYHGTSNTSFTVFNPQYSDDGTSLFFTDSNTVAKGYSGTMDEYIPGKKYTVKELTDIINDSYLYVTEEDGKYHIVRNKYGDLVKEYTTDTLEEMQSHVLEEYGSTGAGNYKVYLNLKNPLIVDAKSKNWNGLAEFNHKTMDKYNYILVTDAGYGDYVVEWADSTNQYGESEVEYGVSLEWIEEKFGEYVKYRVESWNKRELTLDDIVVNKDTRELVPNNTREYAYYAKERGYDSVIIRNVVDTGIYSAGDEKVENSIVAIAFSPEQVKSVANENPTSDPDIRYSDRDAEKSVSVEYYARLLENSAYYPGSNVAKEALAESSVVRDAINEYGTDYYNKLRFGKNLGKEEKRQARVLKKMERILVDMVVAERLATDKEFLDRYVSENYKKPNMLDYHRDSTRFHATIHAEEREKEYRKLKGILSDFVSGSAKDNKGRSLTKAQQEFFKDNHEVFYEDGRLKQYYHGTDEAGFFVFDSSKSDDGLSLFVTDDIEVASTYMRAGSDNEFNPYKTVTEVNTLEDLQRRFAEGDYVPRYENGKYIIYDTDFEEDVVEADTAKEAYNEWTERFAWYGEDSDSSRYYALYVRSSNPLVVDANYSYWDDIEFNGKTVTTRWLAEYASGKGYDSVVINNVNDFGPYKNEYANDSQVVVVFNSNQLKSIYNENPTSDSDIRYAERQTESIYDAVGELKRVQRENDKLKADIERLRKKNRLERTVTGGRGLNESHIAAVAGRVLNLADSRYSKAELTTELKEIYKYLQSEDVEWDVFMSKATDLAQRVVAEARERKVTNDYAKMILSTIRSARISLNDTQKAEAEYAYGKNWNRSFFGRVTIANDGIPLDSVWSEWASMYPDVFDADISDADMVTALLDIYDSTRTASEVVETYDKSEAARSIAFEIYNQFWNVSPVRTLADKHDKEVKRLKFEHRQEMKELREKTDKKVFETQWHYSKLIHEVRESRDEKIAQLKKESHEYTKQYREKIERRNQISQITKKSLKLNKWLKNNSKDEHIVEELKEPVKAVLKALDFSSERLLGTGVPTQKDISLKKAFEHLYKTMQDIEKRQGEEDYTIDMPVDYVEFLEGIKDQVGGIVERVGDNEYVLRDMTLEQLQDVNKMLSVLTHIVTSANKALADANGKAISTMAQSTMLYANDIGAKSKKVGAISDFFNFDNGLPVYVFKMMGEGGRQIFRNLQNGWDKMAFHVKQIADYTKRCYDAKDVREWSKEIHEFTFADGSTVQMTTAQIMSLYCLQKREQARLHLLKGGMRVADFKIGTDKITNEDGALLLPHEIDEAVSVLTARQKRVADDLQMFMNTVCSDWGNEVSMKRFGIKSFGEENYFPIQSDASVVTGGDTPNSTRGSEVFRLLNMDFTKSLNAHANNRIVVDNIFDVFATHTSDMAKYNALALPVLDMFRWYNYKESYRINPENPEDTRMKANSLKQSLVKAYGDGSTKYIMQFMKDINGAHSGGMSNIEKLGRKMISNYKVAAVGANIRVAILQPTSYVRASAVIDPKYLAMALTHKPQIQKAKDTCGIALWKSLGFYDTNISRGVASLIKHDEGAMDWIRDKSMKLAEWGDAMTWGYLYNACEAEIKATQPGLTGEAKDRAVADRLRDVIYATQVVDSTMTRTQNMRNSSWANQVMTSFMSEPSVSYNLLHDLYIQYNADKRQLGKSAAFKKNGKKIARVTASYLVTLCCASLAGGLVDAMRDDDDEDEFFEKLLSNAGENAAADALGMLPVIKDAVSIYKGYNVGRMDMQGIQSSYYTVRKLYKAFLEGEWDYKTVYSLINSTAKTASQISGIPASNALRDVIAIWNSTIGEVFESLKVK